MASIGAVARIKRDRFASLSCTHRGSFVVETKVPPGCDSLTVNHLCGHGGAVRVAICDLTGGLTNNRWPFNPLPGFALDDCVTLEGDTVAGKVSFRQAQVRDLPVGKTVYVEIELFRSEVFAFEWSLTDD
jgi:hypothetical protein